MMEEGTLKDHIGTIKDSLTRGMFTSPTCALNNLVREKFDTVFVSAGFISVGLSKSSEGQYVNVYIEKDHWCDTDYFCNKIGKALVEKLDGKGYAIITQESTTLDNDLHTNVMVEVEGLTEDDIEDVPGIVNQVADNAYRVHLVNRAVELLDKALFSVAKKVDGDCVAITAEATGLEGLEVGIDCVEAWE